MKKDITMGTILLRNKNIPSTCIDDEIGFMNIDTGKYYSLNSVGSDIWNKIDGRITLEDLIDSLTLEYEVDKDTCAAQVKNFIETMIDEGIILVG